jgi:hypothetical protein
MVFPLFAVGVIRLRTAPTILLAIGIVSVVWVSIASYLFDQLPSLNSWAIGHFGSIAGISNGYQDSFFRWLLYFSPYLRLGEFLVGCLIAQLYVVWLDRPASTIETRFGVALLAVALASIPVFTYLMYSPNGWLPLRRLNFNFGLAPSVAITVFCLARYRSRVSQLTSWRPLVTLGEASYSIYLLHFPVFRHLQPFGANTFFAKSGAAYREFLPLLIGRLTLAIAAVLIVALISYRIVEIPARSWLRRLFALDWRLPSRNAALAVLAVSLPAAVLVVRPHLAEVDGNLTKGIRVLTATYGLNCGAPPGNATHRLQRACNGRGDCRYVVSVAVLGDSAPNCGKSFRVEYECAPNPGRLAEEIPGEAGFNSPILLSCNRATTSANVR